MATRLQHVGLIVSDLERSRRFYGEALGLEEVPRPPNFTFAGAWFRFGEDEIHLVVEADTTSRAGAPDPGPGLAGGAPERAPVRGRNSQRTWLALRFGGRSISRRLLLRVPGPD